MHPRPPRVSLAAPRRAPSTLLALVALPALVTLAACGGSGPAAGTTGPDDPTGDPGVPAVYELATVNGTDVPYLIPNDIPGNPLRGYTWSGTLTVRANGTFTYSLRSRLYDGNRVVNDHTSSTTGTWTAPNDGRVVFTPSSGGHGFEMLRTWYSLTHHRSMDLPGNPTWTYVLVRD